MVCVSGIFLAGLFGLFGGQAFAQCAVISGPGPTPWPTCTTWTGPSWNMIGVAGDGKTTMVSLLGAADLNGDGLADLFFLGGTGDLPAVGFTTNTGSSFAAGSTITGSANNNCYQGNFDGSGRTSLACLSAGNISYAISNGTGFSAFANIAVTSGLTGYRHSDPRVETANPCFVMDVDGDGTDDLVCGAPPSIQNPPSPQPGFASSWGVYLKTGSGFTYETWTGPANGYTQSEYCVVGDFNGDGLKDLACAYKNSTSTWTMLLSTGTGWLVQSWANGPVSNTQIPCQQAANETGLCALACVTGDFDGDGIDDIACGTSTSGQVAVGFGGGHGGFKKAATWSGATGLNGGTLVLICVVTDIYGTGRSGILCPVGYGNSSTTWAFAASTGTGFSTTTFSTSWSWSGNPLKYAFLPISTAMESRMSPVTLTRSVMANGSWDCPRGRSSEPRAYSQTERPTSGATCLSRRNEV